MAKRPANKGKKCTRRARGPSGAMRCVAFGGVGSAKKKKAKRK